MSSTVFTWENSVIRQPARILVAEAASRTPRACAPCKSRFIRCLTKAILRPYKWPTYSGKSGEQNTHSPHPSRCSHLRSLLTPHAAPPTTAGCSRRLSSPRSPAGRRTAAACAASTRRGHGRRARPRRPRAWSCAAPPVALARNRGELFFLRGFGGRLGCGRRHAG